MRWLSLLRGHQRIAIWGLVLVLAAVSVVAQVRLQHIREQTSADISLFADELPGALVAFERHFGYAGLIHAFKNYVLRTDEPIYRDEVLHHFELAKVELDALETMARKAEIPFDAEVVRQTMIQYRENLDVITDAAINGLSPAQIDDMVRIDDAPATAALDAFLSATRMSFRDTVGGQIQTLTFILRIISVLSFVLPLVITIFAFLRQCEQRSRIAEAEAFNLSLEASNALLRQTNQSLSDFADIASHDLRTPMRAIANHAQFLVEDHGEILPKEAHRRLGRIEALGKHADDLVANLLHYARMDSAQIRETVDCEAIIEAVSLELSDILDAGGACVKLKGALPTVIGDPTEVATIFRNLILNGLTYNKSNTPCVTVGFMTKAEADGKIFENVYFVQDNGIGIEEELQADAFRMFKRLNPPDSFAKGTGSGLAFVKKAVESLGGNVWLTSKVDEGSTFFFTLSPSHSTAPVS